MNELHILARSYLDLQQTRIACDARIRKLEEANEHLNKPVQDAKGDTFKILIEHRDTLKGQEKQLLAKSSGVFTLHPIWEWCERVRGLSDVAAMTFLGYIDGPRCTSAGKMYAYLGLIPQARLHSGEKASFNPELKGR